MLLRRYETVIDNCVSTPCQNGATCVNGANVYTCLCPTGYNDLTCSTGVKCLQQNTTEFDRKLFTFQQWRVITFAMLHLCAVINNCASTPCYNGATCVNGVQQYKCNCAAGYTDMTCFTGTLQQPLILIFQTTRFYSKESESIMYDKNVWCLIDSYRQLCQYAMSVWRSVYQCSQRVHVYLSAWFHWW